MTISSPISTPSAGSLLHVIEQEHCAEMFLCDRLEQLADALPEPLDTEITPQSIATLRRCVRRHIILEEKYLFPMLMKRAKPGEFNEELLTQICREHAADESHAYEAADEMEGALSCGRVLKPDMLGYMLRCLFESRRRHIAWENAIIFPLARLRLSKSDFASFCVTEFEEDLGEDLFNGLSQDKRCCCLRSEEE